VLSPSGYLVTYRWDGTLENHQVIFLGAACAGAAALNGKSLSARSINAKRVVYSGLKAQVYLPGATTSAAFGAGSYDSEGACRASNIPNLAWALNPTSRATVGIPATVSGPLTVQ
jgi:hypothetical protein